MIRLFESPGRFEKLLQDLAMWPENAEPEKQVSDDSRVRDHLANERTYLAWMRSAIATMGIGVVIARLRYMDVGASDRLVSSSLLHAAGIGLVFNVIGILTVVISTWRFLVARKQIRKQRYVNTSGFIVVFSGVVFILGLCILWYLTQGLRR